MLKEPEISFSTTPDLPRFQTFGGEKMLSGTGDPRPRDEVAIPERVAFVVQNVDDVIQQFRREAWSRNGGSRSARAKLPLSRRSRAFPTCRQWLAECTETTCRKRPRRALEKGE